jgi:hypothetical protein
MPLSPLDRAAESLAPAPPTTNFFGSPSPIAALYNARRDAESSAQLADAATRLGRSRWDRAAQRRQLVQWGREDEEHQARKDFEAQRGDFLQQIALIDPTDPDYENAKAKLLGTLPRQAMDDDAVRAIFAAKDRTYSGLVEDQERMKWYEQRQADAATKAWEAAQVKAAQAGMTPEEIGQYSDPLELGFAAGQRARDLYEAKLDAESERIKDRANGRSNNTTVASARSTIDTLTSGDKEAFPSHVDTAFKKYVAEYNKQGTMEGFKGATGEAGQLYARAEAFDKSGADGYIAEATKAPTADAYAKQVPGLSEDGKERRRRVWHLAKQILGESGAPPAEPAAQPALGLPAPPRPGAPIDVETARLFIRASGQNMEEAMQRAEAAGWTVPR